MAGEPRHSKHVRTLFSPSFTQDEDFQLHPQEVPRPSSPEDEDALMAEARAACKAADPLAALGLTGGGGGATSSSILPLLSAHLALRASLLAGVRASIALDFEGAAQGFAGATTALQVLTAGRPADCLTPASTKWPPPSFDPAAARATVAPVPPRPDRAFASVKEGLNAYTLTLIHLSAAAALPEAATARGGGLRCMLRALGDLVGLGAGALPRSVASLAMGLGVEPLAAASVVPGDGDGGEAAPPAARPTPPGPAALSEAAVCVSLALPPPHALPTPSASTFVAQAALGLQGWGVACLLNRARSRRRMRRALEDWVHVHQHAAVAEADPEFMEWMVGESGWAWPWPAQVGGAPPPPPPPDAPGAGAGGHASPLSAWVEEAGARCAGAHLLAGFGLHLYAPYEHVGVLWYADYLARREAAAADALAVRWPVRRAGATTTAPAKKKGGGKKGTRSQPPSAAHDPLLGPPPTKADPVAAAYAAADAAAAGTRATCLQAALRASAGLAAAGMTPPAYQPFNGPADRFRARFGCLATLTAPPPLTYADFEAHVLAQLDAASADPARAADLVRGGKDGFAWVRSALTSAGGRAACGLEAGEATALARLAGANAVALGLLESELAGFEVEYESSSWLWAVKLKRRKA